MSEHATASPHVFDIAEQSNKPSLLVSSIKVAVVSVGRTFISVEVNNSISVVTSISSTAKCTVGLGTRNVVIAIVGSIGTLIMIKARDAVSVVVRVARAGK